MCAKGPKEIKSRSFGSLMFALKQMEQVSEKSDKPSACSCGRAKFEDLVITIGHGVS